jgi:AcrR family transcriptional regulator
MWYMAKRDRRAPSSRARDLLLERVVTFVAENGVSGRSLRDLAAGVGTSHRMLIYHFGSYEGLLAAIVAAIEAQQRAAMARLAATASTPREAMMGLWDQVSSPQLRPFVRLFFEVFGMAAQGVPGTAAMLENLTEPWLTEGLAAAGTVGTATDATALRLGVAASRGLLLDLLAGADPEAVRASYELFVAMFEHWADHIGQS